jgi:hypothetical protein
MMAAGSAGDPSHGVESPFDSMRDRVEVAAAFAQWLLENGHTERGHCSGCDAYYRHTEA